MPQYTGILQLLITSGTQGGRKTGMAKLVKFSRWPMTNIWLTPITITNILEITDISVYYIYIGGKSPKFSWYSEPIIIWPKPITDILSVLTFTDTDSRYFKKSRYMPSLEKKKNCVMKCLILWCHYFRLKLGLGQTFNDVLVLGRRFSGPEAVAAGFVKSAVPTTDLIDTATQLAGQLLVQGPYKRESLQAMKQSVYQSIIDYVHQDSRMKSSL